MATGIAKAAYFDTNTKNLQDLKVDSDYLELLREEFQRIVNDQKILIHTFQESQGFKGVRGLNRKVCQGLLIINLAAY